MIIIIDQLEGKRNSCHVVTETEESYSGNLQHSQHT